MPVVHRLLNSLRRLPQEPILREILRFSAPALLVGFVVRALLTAQMPYGYMQFDTGDYLITAWRFMTHGDLVIHGKKTFLVPIFFTLPCLVRLPVLIVIPMLQHLLGLGIVWMIGALVRFWFAWWKWLIVPVTLITALNPVLLWFEHALLGEAVYLFCIVMLALAGTLFVRKQSAGRFAWLMLMFFLTAGARPEGKLLLPFGFLLVLFVCWRNWKNLAIKMAIMLAVALITNASTRSSQAGQLLYSTVLPLSPDQSKVAPDFSSWILPLRDQTRAEFGDVPTKLTTLEKNIGDLAKWYLSSRSGKERKMEINAFCEKLAVEAMLTHPFRLPVIAWKKFLLGTISPVSVGFNNRTLYDKQIIGFMRKGWLPDFARFLVGHPFTDRAEIDAFVHAHYQPLKWYDKLDAKWRHYTLKVRPREPKRAQFPSTPYFFQIALFGMALALVRPGKMRALHVAWLAALFGLWFGVMLTGVVNPRYRFAFESFCLIYVFFLLDCVFTSVYALVLRFRPQVPVHEAATAQL